MQLEQAMAKAKNKEVSVIASPLRAAGEGDTVQIVPILSRRTGKVVRYNLYLRSPEGEKGQVGK